MEKRVVRDDKEKRGEGAPLLDAPQNIDPVSRRASDMSEGTADEV